MKWYPDWYAFVRKRAEQLFAEGKVDEARALLVRLDDRQAARFVSRLSRKMKMAK